jgi:hypothetical protein
VQQRIDSIESNTECASHDTACRRLRAFDERCEAVVVPEEDIVTQSRSHAQAAQDHIFADPFDRDDNADFVGSYLRTGQCPVVSDVFCAANEHARGEHGLHSAHT